MLYCSHKDLLIDIPPFRKRWFSPGVLQPLKTAAVGLTDEMKSEWTRRIQEVVGEPADAGESPS